jgi:hypothetical protein
MTIERRYTGAFDVYKEDGMGNQTLVDTVFWTAGTKDEVRRSLINHDGYDSDIVVVPNVSGILPLTEKELEELCSDNDVTFVRETNGWFWNAEDADGDMRHGRHGTKLEAMRYAVEILELDTEGEEDGAE